MSTSSSLLFSDLPTPSTFSSTSTYSRDSWCSAADYEASVSSTTLGHISHDGDSLDKLVLASLANNAIFGSTSPRKNRSGGVRSSTESSRSWASSSSSIRSPRTPITPLFSHPENDVTKTPTLATISLPWIAEPKLKKRHLSRLVSDEVQYIGRSLDVPVSEEIHEERVGSLGRSSSSARRHPASGSRFNTWNGKDGLMIAMDELEQELARTMATLSTSTSNAPVSTISKARGKSMRRPHTADKVMARGTNKSLRQDFSHLEGSSSAASASQARFQRESWMSTNSNDDSLTYNGRPIRFSASDLTLLSEAAEIAKQSDAEIRPTSIGSNGSSASSRGSRADMDSPSVPALVFDGRLSGASSSASAGGSFREAPSRPESFVTAENDHIALPNRMSSNRGRPSTARGSPKSGFYQLNKGSRSVPSLAATSEPPCDPLPPLPSLPAGLNFLLGGSGAPPRPPRSAARTPISSHRNSPVPFYNKALPALPC